MAGTGTGSWVQFEFARPVMLGHLEVSPGKQKGKGSCGRVKRLRLTFSDGSNQENSFEDESKPQTVTIESRKPTSSLKMEFLDVYRRSSHGELCLSEVDFLP
jgi:hypothetical protein